MWELNVHLQGVGVFWYSCWSTNQEVEEVRKRTLSRQV